MFPDDDARAVFTRRLKRWGAENRRAFPWRETSDPFRILVAEVLLQRSRGKTVAAVYEELFRRWPDAHALSRARTPSIASVIRPLGLVKRAETLRSLAAEVVRLGGVPDTLDGLLALPGVGRYAASATLAVGFGEARSRGRWRDGARLPPLLRPRGRRPGLRRHRAVAAGRARDPADPRPRVELGGPRPRSDGLPPEGPSLLRVPPRDTLCLVTAVAGSSSVASASIGRSDHSGVIFPST